MIHLATMRSTCLFLVMATAVACLSSCGLFRRGDDGGGGEARIESLGDYRLAEGNVVFLEMFEGGRSTLAVDLTVDVEGNLELPGIGAISVAGMPPLAAAKKIEFLARNPGQNHLGGPQVQIKALDRRAVVHVSGNVTRPGPVTFFPGVTLAEVIEAAGGVDADANISAVGLTSGGRKSIVTALETRELKEGDVVNVPRRL